MACLQPIKTNEFKRLERNLLNQNFDYYLPKITIKKFNSKPKEEVRFLAIFLFIHLLIIIQLFNIH